MFRIALCLLGLGVLAGCGSSQKTCREGTADDVEMGARTAGAAAETGATTAVEGVKTFGKSVGGLFEDGSDGAKAGWNEGAKDTKSTAREGADETSDEASLPRCK